VSSNLTRILVLYDRLSAEYNPRYLPVTVKSVKFLINELEELGNDDPMISLVLKETIEWREKYSIVFSIPELLKSKPNIEGLREAAINLSKPLIENYCMEEKKFLKAVFYDDEMMLYLYSRTKNNCLLLEAFCDKSDFIPLLELTEWCDDKLAMEGLQAAPLQY